MIRLFGLVLSAALLAACTTAPIMYAPNDMTGDPATGSVKPLRDLLPAKGGPIRVVFIHGVGDHCYGYALGPNDGWLSDRIADRLGFRPLGGLSDSRTIFTDVFIDGIVRDERSYVQYATRKFALTLEGVAREFALEAIEITWSHTTQWAKSNYLGYDSPSVTPAPGAPSSKCVEAPDIVVQSIKPPPHRLLLDRIIKEQVFDRNLSDAILYAGSYGALIERGVAEALCHAFTASPPDTRCTWPSADIAANDPHTYFFITHSLGSRIIYDTILNLVGYDTPARPNPFSESEWKAAEPFVSRMLANTPAFYMMANQLSLLGLANLPVDARSDEVVRPLVFAGTVPEGGRAVPLRYSTDVGARGSRKQPCSGLLAAIGEVRLRASRAHGIEDKDAPALQLVAFNDTNDLLTWHIPHWYANGGPNEKDCRPKVELVNIFVQNAAHWLIIEPPLDAHVNYFKREDVWKVMTCGASNGVLLPCRS